MTEPAARPATKRALTLDDYAAGVLAGDRVTLARAITLVESTAAAHTRLAHQLLERLSGHTGGARRVGITGPPGAGKSTLIDALGTTLTAAGHRVAVLAVDPTSGRTGGSLLGDKTRMGRLSVDPAAFIRPSPTAGTLGGVARKTRESILLCEAAGYDVVLVETVGVGQSETTVHSMVDCFLVLLLAGAGDELQGIKKGIIELADAIAITKADGENLARANRSRVDYQRALEYLAAAEDGWKVPVVTVSSKTGEGLEALWQTVEAHRANGLERGSFAARRARQAREWMRALLDEQLRHRFLLREGVAAELAELEARVERGELAPELAVERLLGPGDAF